jgi:hypothetical protein
MDSEVVMEQSITPDPMRVLSLAFTHSDVNNPTASSTSPHGLLILYLEAQQEDFFL